MKDKLLRLKPETHIRLKRMAVDNGLSMGEMVEALLGGEAEFVEQPKVGVDDKLKLEYEQYCREVDADPYLRPMTRQSRKEAWRKEHNYGE